LNDTLFVRESLQLFFLPLSSPLLLDQPAS